MSDRADRTTRVLAQVAVAIALVALVVAGYALYQQQEAEARYREISEELQRALTPSLPMRGPPLELDPDDT